jgi:hypothetical protein
MGEPSGLEESSRSSEIGVWEASETGEATTTVETDSARNREVNEKACITRGEGKTEKTGRRGKMNPAFKRFRGRRHEANSIYAVGILG